MLSHFPILLRLISLSLTLLVTSAPVVLQAHATSHVHRWCAEHATMEEQGANPTASDPTLRGVTAGAPVDELRALTSTVIEEDAHAACLAAALGFRLDLAASSEAVGPSMSELDQVQRSSSAWIPRPLSVLAVAPKGSPPAES